MSTTRTLAAAAALALPLSLAACGGGGDGSDGTDGTAAGETRTLRFAHSYTDTQPQSECGAKVIQEELANADVGLEVEIFGSSQLGGDADRISAVVSGDIDMDMQGASALGAVYEPIGIIDGAYVFEDGQQLSDFIAGEDSQEMRDAFHEASGVTVLGAWSAGARQFTANKAIRTPEDLKGLRMRFPNSEQYLMNAAAMGAEATEVAYEELYLALQQGTVDGQENPIVNIQAISLHEVQDYLSMSSHQLNSNLIIVGPVWDELNEEQKTALQDAVSTAVGEVPGCVEEAEQAALDEWRSSGDMEIVEDVDVEAFRAKAKAYFEENLEGDKLELYQTIQNSIGG
ncbi:DctP family TRAP transporter solute-binding subunit [Ornithinimicrobium tianjinense]|uniref:ABC transporter substrate-binding protein n=1 Tax=Ornithinimicrobium tianjinense TaxID=1195761 RepID=A0A917BHX1_9MICO|nr:DctP family TRAP transporter solute-binding subunit [Ornithinimicrobium tianjinense]GGF40688.1 ABC transporter substrate-binding protein [Ornithinimicrobium tianjinense]